ncbi:MAG TPA: hypothetical protein VNA29_09715 [Sphingomicrobium sp.]|nr:hypothetical protein [Sphingomicrobium sp.]
MRNIALAVSAALLFAAPAAARSNAQPAPAETKTAQADKKVCKRLEVTGSRIAEKVCLTRDEWKKVEEVK